MKGRIVISVVLLLLAAFACNIWGVAEGPLQGRIAVSQLDDSDAQYATSHALLTTHSVPTIVWLICLVLLLALWIPFLWRKLKTKPKTGPTAMLLPLALIGSLALTGCGPYHEEKIEEIGPNETAFMVPLEGATKANQGKFMSEEYLNEHKVATKRFVIPTRRHDLGRTAGNYEWIPTVKLIKVLRTPVTRQWTDAHDTGTSTSKQAIAVESKESIDFYTGVTASAYIAEEDAAKFLYYFAGKALADVMDSDVRGYIQKALWNEFGSLSLTEGRLQKKEIMARTEAAAMAFFKPQGITIRYLGGSEGLTYRDPKIQAAINSAFVAENDKAVAEQQRLAQETRNKTTVAIATAAREAAEQFAKAQQAQIAKTELEIRMKQAEAQLELAKNLKDLKGQLPSVVPPGSAFLFGLDQKPPK